MYNPGMGNSPASVSRWPSEVDTVVDGQASAGFGVGNQTDGTVFIPVIAGLKISGVRSYKPASPPGVMIKFQLWDVFNGVSLSSVTTAALPSGAGVVLASFSSSFTLLTSKQYAISKHESTGFAKWSSVIAYTQLNGAIGSPGWCRISGCFVAGDAFPMTGDTTNMYFVDPVFV